MKSYNGKKIELPTHRLQLRRHLLHNYEKMAGKKLKPLLFTNWKTLTAGFVIILILVIGTLNLPFQNSETPQKVSAKSVIEKAKENYLGKTQRNREKILYPESYEDTEVWDYFPENNILVLDEFDEYGFFEVLDNYDEELFSANLIENTSTNSFYEVEFTDKDHKIQVLLDPKQYNIIQIDLYDAASDQSGSFTHRFSQQWD